jgi:zinc-binding in reverse transcriptase
LFYLWLDNGGVISKDFDIIWHSKIPLKIQIFMCLVRKNKILTKENLLKKEWQGSSKCVFCPNFENADHLFVVCPFVKCIWN